MANPFHFRLAIPVVFGVVAITAWATEPSKVSVCDVTSNASRYIGQVVTLEAEVVRDQHQVWLRDGAKPDCPQLFFSDKWLEDGKFREVWQARVIHRKKGHVCQECFRFEVRGSFTGRIKWAEDEVFQWGDGKGLLIVLEKVVILSTRDLLATADGKKNYKPVPRKRTE